MTSSARLLDAFPRSTVLVTGHTGFKGSWLCEWLLLLGASAAEILIFVLLFCILMSVEALNTAIEVMVDHLSPGYTEFAKAAKDLASFAVFSMLLAGGIYVAAVTAAKFGWIVLW